MTTKAPVKKATPEPIIAPIAGVAHPVGAPRPIAEDTPTPTTTELSASIAALVMMARHRLVGTVSDARGNQAQRQVDGSVRVSIRQPDKSHVRYFVRCPETITMELVENA